MVSVGENRAEVAVVAPVGNGGGSSDPGGRTPSERGQQQLRQQEVPKVISDVDGLVAFRGHLERHLSPENTPISVHTREIRGCKGAGLQLSPLSGKISDLTTTLRGWAVSPESATYIKWKPTSVLDQVMQRLCLPQKALGEGSDAGETSQVQLQRGDDPFALGVLRLDKLRRLTRATV